MQSEEVKIRLEALRSKAQAERATLAEKTELRALEQRAAQMTNEVSRRLS